MTTETFIKLKSVNWVIKQMNWLVSIHWDIDSYYVMHIYFSLLVKYIPKFKKKDNLVSGLCYDDLYNWLRTGSDFNWIYKLQCLLKYLHNSYYEKQFFK